MTIGGILAFLIANGPSLIAAGSSVASIVSSFFEHFGGRGKDDAATLAEFNAFVDRCIGTGADVQDIVNKARMEIVSVAPDAA